MDTKKETREMRTMKLGVDTPAKVCGGIDRQEEVEEPAVRIERIHQHPSDLAIVNSQSHCSSRRRRAAPLSSSCPSELREWWCRVFGSGCRRQGSGYRRQGCDGGESEEC